MKILLTLFVLLFSSSVVAEDISDFEIEGMSIGDSLLDYFSEEEIIEQIKETRYMYEYLTDEFGEVYLYKEFKDYDYLAIIVRSNDKEYKIEQIRGIIPFNNDINECYKKQKEISNQLESGLNLKDYKINEETIYFPKSLDPSGKSFINTIDFILKSGAEINIACSKFEKNIKNINGWDDGLDVVIATYDAVSWFRNHIN